MAGGERPSTEEDRWGGFTKGMRAVKETTPIERSKFEFTKIAPVWRRGPNVELVTQIFDGDDIKLIEPPPPPPPPPSIPKHSPLDDIANLLRALTYGEMIELAGEIWRARGEGDIILERLPVVLHLWSTKRATET